MRSVITFGASLTYLFKESKRADALAEGPGMDYRLLDAALPQQAAQVLREIPGCQVGLAAFERQTAQAAQVLFALALPEQGSLPNIGPALPGGTVAITTGHAHEGVHGSNGVVLPDHHAGLDPDIGCHVQVIDPGDQRAARRFSEEPLLKGYNLGLRCVRSM